MVLLLKPYLGIERAVAGAGGLPSRVLSASVLASGFLALSPTRCGSDGRTSCARARPWAASPQQLTPKVLALATFVAGVVLFFSGATPARLDVWRCVDRVLPLAVIEASHFLGSVLGAALLILSQGLARRLDAAYYLTLVAIVAGMVTSLLKGFDFEEATLLFVLLVVLWRARPAFNRKAAFFDTRFSAGWVAALAGAIGASVWLGLFAFKHVNYSDELWWQFELHGEASRFLRATVGAAVAVHSLRIGTTRRLRAARGAHADRCGPRRRGARHRDAKARRSVPGVPARQGAAVQRRAGRPS